MKILLLNPPFLPRYSREQRSPAVTKSGTLYYPMWLSYAAGLLEDNGFECTLIDGVVPGGEKRLTTYTNSENPDLIIIDTSTPSIENDLGWAKRLKNMFPGAFILLVGPHVSALGESIVSEYPWVDGVARGEYEFISLELAQSIRNGKRDLSGIDGLTYREDGKVKKNKKRRFIRDLDSIPFVSRTYLKHLKHTDYFYAHSKYPIVAILTARGCSYGCIYCLYPQTFSGQVYRPRSIESVVEELEFIQGEFHPLREVMFEDDTFVIDEDRTVELCEAIIKSDFNLPFSCNTRPDLSYQTLKILKRAGCRLMCVGFESGNQRILDFIKKETDLGSIERFVRDARRAGIMIHGCFMVGTPEDDYRTIMETYRFAERLNTDTAQFFPIMLYPGTTLYRWAEKNGYIKVNSFRDWLTREGLHNCIVSTPNLSGDDLVRFCNDARRHYYLRPIYTIRKLLQSFTNIQEAIRNLKAAGNLLRHLIKY